jgi:DNA polymerase/3'-5' exonuclease PolX
MNEEIIENLNILAKYYKKNDLWRFKAYKTAISALNKVNIEITDVSQIKNIKGIGKSTRSKIKEFLETGKIALVEKLRSEISPKNSKEIVIEQLLKVWGIGEAKAEVLYNKNIRSLDDLRKNQSLLTKNQKIGLKYYEELLKKIPREYIYIFQLVIRVILIHEFGFDSFRMEVAGSYRRGLPRSGDIDCLITSKIINLQDIIRVLIKWGVVTDVLSMKNEKFMGVVHCPNGQWFHFRMDIEFLPEENWGSGLLYFTGSKDFNTRMRADAKRKGMTLNQNGLYDSQGIRLPLYTEKEIMQYLGMEYVVPSDR